MGYQCQLVAIATMNRGEFKVFLDEFSCDQQPLGLKACLRSACGLGCVWANRVPVIPAEEALKQSANFADSAG